nr:MAG TPA: hypothetical protein [Caudoviricetes sp.]
MVGVAPKNNHLPKITKNLNQIQLSIKRVLLLVYLLQS